MRYYSAVKRNELLKHATTWMNLKNTILSERHQTQKTKYYMIPFIKIFLEKANYRGRKQNSDCLGLGMARGSDSKKAQKDLG